MILKFADCSLLAMCYVKHLNQKRVSYHTTLSTIRPTLMKLQPVIDTEKHQLLIVYNITENLLKLHSFI